MLQSFAIALLALLLLLAGIGLAQDDRLSPQSALQAFTVAEGLDVKTFAADPEIVSISNIDVDHRGRVWACECVNYRGNNGKRPAGDRILILEDTNGDGKSDKTSVFYQGRDIDIAMGLCVLGNKAIVSVAPDILLLEDTNGDDRADKKTVLLTSDAEFQHDHSLHSFVFGPDGRFYGNFGNTGHGLKNANGQVISDNQGRKISDNGNPFRGGIVFRCDRSFENFEVLGHNFRNNYEATIDSFGGVWQSDNDDDGNLAVRLNYILEGGNYGYLDELTGERWQKSRIGAHPFRGKRHWHQNDPGSIPNVLETGNGAPTGITIYEGRLLPSIFWDQVIHCDAGPHVVWGLPVTRGGAGFSATKADLLRSSDNNFRPVDVAVAPDGSLFVSDWYDPVVGGFQQDDIERGRIYWIAPPGQKYTPPKIELDSLRGAAEALTNPNYCARYLAWMLLHARGNEAEKHLAELLRDPNPRLRARALWLLGQIPGKESTYIRRAIGDDHSEVRTVGLRLAQLLKRDVMGLVQQLVNDPHPRVRAECAVQLRHHNSRAAAKVWAELAAQHDGHDRWYLEALGIGADGKWDACLDALLARRLDLATETWKDLVWRSRGTSTPSELSRILSSTNGKEDARRYIRAFDFQSSDRTEQALISVAFDQDHPADIALGAIRRLPPAVVKEHSRGRTRLLEVLAESPIDSASIELIKEFELAELYPRLLAIAQGESDARVDAMVSLLELEQEQLVSDSLRSDEMDRATATARALAMTRHLSATELLVPYIMNSSVDMQVRKEVARDLSLSLSGAFELLRLTANGQLPDGIQEAIAVRMLIHSSEDVRKRSGPLFVKPPAKDARPLPSLRDLVTMRGNSQSGKQVAFKQGKCTTCHQILGEGKAIGPELSEIGTKLARAALYESILYPSAAISHNYETYAATLLDGQVTAGLMVNQNDQRIQLRDADGIVRTLDRSRVEGFKRQSVSLMPSNLHEALTVQELVDLVEYLSTLKANDK